MTTVSDETAKVQDALKQKYLHHFNRQPVFSAYAPGRVEVLGNHTDYNEGFVLSAAINMGTFFVCSPNDTTTCRLVAGDIMEETVFDIAKPEKVAEMTWSNYVRGVIDGLGIDATLPHGFDGMFLGNIPLGAGLSSSAALEMSSALCLSALYGLDTSDKLKLAKTGQRAEHLFAGVKCGLLDQMTSLFGAESRLVHTDFRSLQAVTVPISSDVCLLMCNTHAKHSLTESAYNERRAHCEAAAKAFAGLLPHPVTHLRDVSSAEFEKLRNQIDPAAARRAAHVVGENTRVEIGVELLKQNRVAEFGRLMFDSHESSRHNFENSCAELDFLVETAGGIDGVLGARLSGGGFGGSTVVLTQKDAAKTIGDVIRKAYQKKYDTVCDIQVLLPSAGARILTD